MDESMPFEIIRLPERPLALDQLRRTERGESFREERLRVKTRIPAMAQPNREIDLVTLEIREADRG